VPALAYHAVIAVTYSLGPVTLFWLALKLSNSIPYSFAAGIIYSLISPSTFLIPAVRHDVGGFWNPRRLEALVQYGEGPHVTSMTLLPVALLLLIVAFERRRPIWWFLAALGLAAVPLTNWLGAAALAMAVVAWLLSRQHGQWWKNWVMAVAAGIYAYAIACSWIPPSTILNIRSHERYVRMPLSQEKWLYFLLALPALAILFWIFRRLRISEYLRFSILFLFPTAVITLLAEWFSVFLVPQPRRYHLEMEMALVLAVVFSAKLISDRLSNRTPKFVAYALLVLCIYPALRYRNFARHLNRPVQIRKTIEYREARWFDRNIMPHRVFAPGSVGFFLNVWTNTPQYAGGFDPGAINPVFPAVHYQVLSGDNARDKEGEIAVLWLKAYGVDAVSVSGPKSQEVYKPFRNPAKFEGLLPELWRDGDDVIYEVPRRSRSLARVIRRADLPSREPENGLDIDPVLPYVAALENPAYPLAEMAWQNNHSALISAPMRKSQILTVQISYQQGWHARVNGQPRRTYGDHLGQLAVEPECEGPCTVEIYYDGGIEMRLARLISRSCVLFGLAWVFVDWRKRTLRRHPS
jgi:hypothetical protein